MSSFYQLNFLEESMSYIERTARKLMPILNEIKKRMVPEKTVREKTRKSNMGRQRGVETLESAHEDMIDEESQSESNDRRQ
jgi:hypothetical protein